MSSRKDGGGARAAIPRDRHATRRAPARPRRAAAHAATIARRSRSRPSRRDRRRRRPLRRRRRRSAARTARCGFPPSSAEEALTMARHRGRGIASINYPIGMNLGGDPSQALVHSNPERQVHGVAVVDRSRPGHEVGDPADLRRDARRAGRGRLCRHRRFRHRAALHGQFRLARHPSRRQRGDGGGARKRAA